MINPTNLLIARDIKEHYDVLVNVGFDARQALELTCIYQSDMLTLARNLPNKKNPGEDDEGGRDD